MSVPLSLVNCQSQLSICSSGRERELARSPHVNLHWRGLPRNEEVSEMFVSLPFQLPFKAQSWLTHPRQGTQLKHKFCLLSRQGKHLNHGIESHSKKGTRLYHSPVGVLLPCISRHNTTAHSTDHTHTHTYTSESMQPRPSGICRAEHQHDPHALHTFSGIHT